MAKARSVQQVHQFGKARPSGDGNFNTHVSTPQEARDTHFRPLPEPPGKAPYHLDLAAILPAEPSTSRMCRTRSSSR